MAIVRIEQIAPFPYDGLKSTIPNYKNAVFIWAQEGHQNQGAWSFVEPRLERVLFIFIAKR
jgi:2-oxoglutarate dehydrogenase E1 component